MCKRKHIYKIPNLLVKGSYLVRYTTAAVLMAVHKLMAHVDANLFFPLFFHPVYYFRLSFSPS